MATMSHNLILQITLCNTQNPAVGRTLSVPSRTTFAELNGAIARSFNWHVEQCTSWVFKMVDQNPLALANRDDPNNSKVDVAAFWTAPGQGYNLMPGEYATKVAIGQQMSMEIPGRFWIYDYNIARQPHAIEVMEIQSDSPLHQVECVGSLGHINWNAWQFSDLGGLENTIRARKGTWIAEHNVMRSKVEGVQAKTGDEEKDEERKKAEERNRSEETKKTEPGKKNTPEAHTTKLSEEIPDAFPKRRLQPSFAWGDCPATQDEEPPGSKERERIEAKRVKVKLEGGYEGRD